MEKNGGVYSFRLSDRNNKRLQVAMKEQDVGPTEYIRSVLIDHLDNEGTADWLHQEIEGQLTGLFKFLREELGKEQRDFREEVKEELKENRLKIYDGLEALNAITEKYKQHIDELPPVRPGPPHMR